VVNRSLQRLPRRRSRGLAPAAPPLRIKDDVLTELNEGGYRHDVDSAASCSFGIHLAERWFKDPEGNILSISSMPQLP
jgi:hypothetical protein